MSLTKSDHAALPTSLTELIKRRRSEMRFTLREFAEPLGVSYNAISLWEKGETQPDNERVLAWTRSEIPWVKQLGQEIFVARYGPFVETMLRSTRTKVPA